MLPAQSKEDIRKNRLRLHTSIMVAHLLALQGCAFRGHDEFESSNRGNFEVVHAFARISKEIANVENAPKNAKWTSPMIQKEFLNIMANQVRQMIREEVGNRLFLYTS